MAQIIIIEDEALLAKSLARSLMSRKHTCVTATSAEEGLKMLERMPADIALIDLQLPGMSGFEAMKKIRQHDPDIAVIVITAYGTMASAVEAMRSGASDFLRKPIDTEELALAIERALSNARLKHTVEYYRDRELEKTDEDKLIDKSPGMKKVAEVLEKLVRMDLPRSTDYPPILIVGETGTGKDLIARIVHYRGKFSSQPFVEVNCSDLPQGLEEVELFGYEKGAFKGAHRSKRGLFETAEGGTIFLKKIGNINLEAQIKLLQVIDDKCLRHVGGSRDVDVDVRVIAGTNRDLKDKNLFREDLYHRLNHLRIEIPPLRERKEDIIELADLFLQRFCRKYDVDKRLTREAKEALVAYSWPGNARELRQSIERATFLSRGSAIDVNDLNLPQKHKAAVSITRRANVEIDFPNDGIALDDIEKNVIVQALISSGGNVSETARKLRIGREALRYRIKKYSISRFMKVIG